MSGLHFKKKMSPSDEAAGRGFKGSSLYVVLGQGREHTHTPSAMDPLPALRAPGMTRLVKEWREAE
jgi:hypothetical protein